MNRIELCLGQAHPVLLGHRPAFAGGDVVETGLDAGILQCAVDIGGLVEQGDDDAAIPGGFKRLAARFAEQRLLIDAAGIGILDRGRQGAGFDQAVGQAFGQASVNFKYQFDVGHVCRALPPGLPP